MIHLLLDDPPGPDDELVLEGPVAHHLTRVLRARRGEDLSASDGCGGRYRGVVEVVEGQRAVVRLVARRWEPPPAPAYRMIVPVLPADRMAWAMEKLVELGAAVVAPVTTARAKPVADADRLHRRLLAVARAATEQSRRSYLPEVERPAPLAEGLARCQGPCLAADTEGAQPLSEALARVARPDPALTLVTGPEGGFDSRDRALLAQARALPVTLGPFTLRAETAPVVLLAACAFGHRVLDLASLSG